MNYLETVNFNATVRDYEFTRMANRQIRQVVSSESFRDMSSEEIFRFLFREIRLVSFGDYLKRYLYERSGMEEPFREIDDRTWQDVITGAFAENNAPHSFKPTTTRWSTTVKGWLTSERVRRSTVFLLGFGLRMDEDDVGDFLTKALHEDDFRMDDPTEVIFRYCFLHRLPYAKAVELTERFEALPAGKEKAGGAEDCLRDEKQLLRRLSALKGQSSCAAREEMFRRYDDLLLRCMQTAADIYNRDEEEKPKRARRVWTAEDITAADLEQMLCSGIPLTDSGNLTKANLSLLSKHFQSFRPSRQRLEGVQKRQLAPDRFDLITLDFFLWSQRDIPGEQRLRRYADEINGILSACGMSPLYSASPYEAFLLICTLSDCPLAMYTEVWEMSYAGEET
ncbi:MAG: hypothetical protein IKS31_03860 [Clostridia bacterium]|nr:hypothetical protein [Clostridia bacterium]